MTFVTAITTAPADPSVFVAFVERFGLPVALLGVLLLAMFRAGRWLGPRFDRLIDRHERLLDTLEAELSAHGTLLASMQENQSKTLDCLRELKRAQRPV